MRFFDTKTDRDVKWQEFMLYALDHVDPKLGLFCEFGVGHGASATFICDYLSGRAISDNSYEKSLYGFDTYTGLPVAWDKWDKGHFSTGGVSPINRHNFIPVHGLYADSLIDFMCNKDEGLEPIAFAHIDCDLYSSTNDIFSIWKGKFIPGTVIVFDEALWHQNYITHEMKAFIKFYRRWTYTN